VSEAISGHITAFFLFDVAEAIDLARVQRDLGTGVAARLAPKPTTPPYVQYRQPPITFDGSAVAMPETDGFAVRFKVFDYGVFSVALTRHVEGTWADWVTFGLAAWKTRRCRVTRSASRGRWSIAPAPPSPGCGRNSSRRTISSSR